MKAVTKEDNMKIYMNMEHGNVHLTYKEMIAEAVELYGDIDDDTSAESWERYYQEFEI